MKAIKVTTTFPNIESARQIGTLLLERQLVACVNLLPEVESLYTWKGELCQEKEVVAIMKTTESSYSAIEELIKQHHPYDIPMIVAVPLDQISSDYLDWVKSAVPST